jgi:Tfp pilus assembly protein PilZ
MRQRGAVRIVPRSPITVAIQDGGVPYAYGVVANISESGACIWTDAGLDPGTTLSLRLSFPRRSQPLDAEGVVVWGEPRGSSRTRRYGLQWKDQSSPRLVRLKGIITASA